MGDVSKKNFFKIFFLNKVYFPNFANINILNPYWPFSCDYSFWLRDLKFEMCIKDSINKTCWKNSNDLSNEAPKIKLWNHTKKTYFPVFPKISAGHGWSWKFFFANFQIIGPLGCEGWFVIPRNVKKSQNHCTLPASLCSQSRLYPPVRNQEFGYWTSGHLQYLLKQIKLCRYIFNRQKKHQISIST